MYSVMVLVYGESVFLLMVNNCLCLIFVRNEVCMSLEGIEYVVVCFMSGMGLIEELIKGEIGYLFGEYWLGIMVKEY